ncbi:MAG: L-threonylcarbamoyladenylate synthase [Chromatiales bacterium]|nr:L-threonylcarbamoyladenylate synthase [Chromatiales bacterium]
MSDWHVRLAVRLLRRGGVIAYPTEGVFGLGCDPMNAAAVERVYRAKGRDRGKPLTLIAATVEHLSGLIAPLGRALRARVEPTWPGPVTWILPLADGAPPWLGGADRTIAVRVTAHPVAGALARAFGRPIVSTSANRSDRPPARTAFQVRRARLTGVDYVVPGVIGGAEGPTEIRDARDGRVLRPARPGA